MLSRERRDQYNVMNLIYTISEKGNIEFFKSLTCSFLVQLIYDAYVLQMFFFMSPLRRHIFVCFMAKSAFLGGFSALAP